MQTKTCPDCGDDIAATARLHKCGWRQDITKAEDNPLRHFCPHEYLGQRCNRYGTISPNTQGGNGKEPHPGPWYCRDHFPAFLGVYDTKRSPPSDGFGPLKRLVLPKRPLPSNDPEAIEERSAIQTETTSL